MPADAYPRFSLRSVIHRTYIVEPYSATSTPGIEPVMRRWLALEQLHYALPETFVLPSDVALVGRLPGAQLSLGRSRQEAPLTKTHRIASTTVRCSRHCPPRCVRSRGEAA